MTSRSNVRPFCSGFSVMVAFLLGGRAGFSVAASRAERPCATTAAATPDMPVPSGEELLCKLRAIDAVYRAGFTATGTDVRGPSRFLRQILPLHGMAAPRPVRVKGRWQLTMADGCLALVHQPTEVIDPDKPGLVIRPGPEWPGDIWLGRTIFMGRGFDAFKRVLAHERFIDVEEPGNLCVLAGKVLWVLGRGVSQHIQEITSVSRRADGTLAATATGRGSVPMDRWELVIDPKADHMIRAARAYRSDGGDGQEIRFSNSGVLSSGGRCIPEKGVLSYFGEDVSLTFQSLVDKVQPKVLKRVKEMMHAPFAESTRLSDNRVCPDLTMRYEGNQVVAPIKASQSGNWNPNDQPEWQAARRTAEDFLAAASAGKGGQLAAALPEGAELRIKSVHLNHARNIAVAITSEVSVAPESGDKGPLLIRLIRKGNAWLVDWIDTRVTAPITQRMTDALKGEPEFPGMI